jgi:hypothetical protein
VLPTGLTLPTGLGHTRSRGAAVAAPVTVYGPLVFTSGSTEWGGTTVVLRLEPGDLEAAAGDQIRVTTEMGGLSIGATMSCAAGRAKATNDIYDFAATEAGILLCNGEAVLTSNGANLVNEWIGTLPEDFDNTQPFIVSLQFSAAAVCTLSRIASPTILGGLYYKSGVAEAALVNKTGYASWAATHPHLVSKIEIGFFLT